MTALSLWVDQYGGKVYASTRKELQAKAGGGKVSIMYRDKADGSTVRCGYVVGRRWFTQFAPVETPMGAPAVVARWDQRPPQVQP